MEAALVRVYLNRPLLHGSCPNKKRISSRHFVELIQAPLPNKHNHRILALKSDGTAVHCLISDYQNRFSLSRREIRHIHRLKCANSNPAISESILKQIRSISLASIRENISRLTPIGICKWIAISCLSFVAIKRAVLVLLDPMFWVHFSYTWLLWPVYLAIIVAVYGFYSSVRHLQGESTIVEQVAVVGSIFFWLTLVPPAYVNGYLEGWPFVFFFVYLYFFFFQATVRYRVYVKIDEEEPEHDPKWDVRLPKWHTVLFCVGVTIGHWLAAFEGPRLHLIPGGFLNFVIWVLIINNLLSHFHASSYLKKYSDNGNPNQVVQFGPYKWVRHPIYASVMFLFVTYFIALGASLSCLFIIGVCLLYYDKKTKLEESLLVDTFEDAYRDYQKKVKYKLIPFVY